MKEREKIMVIAGGLIVAGIIGWKLLGSRGPAAGGGTVKATIARIEDGTRLRRSVEGLQKELAISIPQISTAEQENKIRTDLGQKTKENKLVVVSITRIESSTRGRTVSSAQSVQYHLDLYGRYDDFMKLITDLERSGTPYVVREIKFDNSPRTPGEGQEGQGGGEQQGGDNVQLPNGENVSLSNLPPAARARAEAYMRSRSGRGGPEGSRKDQPNGRVHATMRVQSYLFPPDYGIVRAQAAAGGAFKSAPAPGMGQSANAAAPAAPASAGKK